MQKITITGDNITIYKEEVNNSSNNNLIANEYDNLGISLRTYLSHGIQVHKYKPLEDLKEKLNSGDNADRQVARKLPKYLLIPRHGVEYNDETKYQIFRNQQRNWVLGYNIFQAYKYGNFYYNTVTGERVKEPKGFNPFDEWEKVEDEKPAVIPQTDFMVASGGNFSQIYMPPWFLNAPSEINGNYRRFLETMNKNMIKDAEHVAYLIRTTGSDNPLGKPQN